MPMPRRFVVVSAVGLADCVEEADPYITMSWRNVLYNTSSCREGGGIIFIYILLLAYRLSPRAGAFGTTVRTRAQGLDDEWKVDDSAAVNPHAALPNGVAPPLVHVGYLHTPRRICNGEKII